jgi:tight adherence protein B
VTRAALLALAAGTSGVLGAWEALAAAERARLWPRLLRLADPLRRAGTEGRAATAAERRRLALVGAGVLAAAGWLLGGVALATVAAVAGPLAALAALRWRAATYARTLDAGAAGAARVLADAVGAGHAVRGAVPVAAAALAGPVGRELAAAARHLELGERTEVALEGLRRRARSRAWDTLVAALLLHRDTGGDLPGVLRRLAASLEEAARARADARTATAQARFSARLVAGMPLAAAALAELASPGFIAGLASHPVSAPLLVVAAVLQAAGLLAIRQVAR